MTSVELLENTFFAYFFSLGDYLFPVFGFVLAGILVIGFLNFFLGIDKREP